MQQLSLFRGVHDTQPRPVTLEELVTMMRTDQSVRDLTEKHRYARATGDERNASRYKKMMASFGVAALFEGGRQQKHIVEFTGLSLVDIDHIPPERMTEVLDLVRADEHTLLAYTTLSGQGIRILFRYKTNDDDNENLRNSVMLSNAKHLAQCNEDKSLSENVCEILRDAQDDKHNVKRYAEQYKHAFLHGNAYYEALTGLPTDGQCKNVGRISTIAYDENLYYNPDATPFIIEPEEKKPVGRPKGGKSEEGRVKSCEAAVLRELARRGVMYEAGSHNKYISDACYMMNRYGVPESDCTAWALDRFGDYQAEGNDVASIVHSCYQQTEEHGTVRPPRNTESRYASIRDIQDWLRNKNVNIRHNVITRKREIMVEGLGLLFPSASELRLRVESRLRDVVPPDGNNSQFSTFNFQFTELTDQHVNSLYCRFCLDTGRQAKISDFYIIIESDFYPEYHPLKEYLESLPAWDGMTDHIDQLASRVRVTGCTQEMHNRYFKKWFVAMVAAWIVDGVTNHEILTYIGPQGIYKSTFMRLLLPPTLRGYFSARNFANRMTKDDRLELTEMGLIALEELDHMKIHELNQLKAITTDPTVNERAAYARYRERREHIASFCGTGNNARFLTDLTSNRRWLPFMVDSIDSPYDTPINYIGTYAQAYALWKQGFRYWFDDSENAELEEHNHNFEEPNLELELIQTYFRLPRENEVGEFYTASRIIETICVSIKTPLYPRNIAIWMNKLGYQQRRRDNMRGWNVILLTATDIKQCQQENARLSNIE